MAALGLAVQAGAGGSGLNTVVVVNRNSPDSMELGNYYAERRHVPPENVLRIDWPGTNTVWSSNDFVTRLLAPLTNMLVSRQLTSQVDYVVLSMDIPFATLNGSTYNATTAALFYGMKPEAGSFVGATNSYYAREAPFSRARPASAPGFSFLAAMITGDSLAEAKQLVDRGASSDGSVPPGPVVLQKTSDPLRNLRYQYFDNTIFNLRVRGVPSVLRTNGDATPSVPGLAGYQTGLANFTIGTNVFSPGAVADSMSSYGGVIFGPNGQTSLLAFLRAGASGSYGTVAEPTSDVQKFPRPMVYFYQARGFDLAESYYQSLNTPYLGLIVGEPLASPYASPGSGSWADTNASPILSGTARIGLRFWPAANGAPFDQVDLFVDGKFFRTLTNLPPAAGNTIYVGLNGYPISYVVPTNASLGTVASGLAALVNVPAVSNAIGIFALAQGDRLELRSVYTNPLAAPCFMLDSSASTSTGRYYRASYLPASFPPQLTAAGLDSSNAFRLACGFPTSDPCMVEASTNLTTWTPILTNSVAGLVTLADPGAAGHGRRFYRLATSVPNPRLVLSAPSWAPGGAFHMHVDSADSSAYVIEASTDLVSWRTVLTNLIGGPLDFVDAAPQTWVRGYYRAATQESPVLVSSVTDLPGLGPLIRVEAPVRPFKIETSTNLYAWDTIFTTFLFGVLHVDANSAIGGGDRLSTWVEPSGFDLLDSVAFGTRVFTLNQSTPSNAWLRALVTTTNGSTVSVGYTNQTAGGTPLDFATRFVDQLNSTPALQGDDGIVCDNLVTNIFGTPSFQLRARSPGIAAAKAVRIVFTASAPPSVNPAQGDLASNLPDLQSRGHLYVRAGCSQLNFAFDLDTTSFSDGFHELTAVAYQGSHARTQTRLTQTVQIRNTALTATLNLQDLTNGAPASGSYPVSVVANTNDVSRVCLFSTGGLVQAVTNQSSAVFSVEGASLGAGLHPFWATIETPAGAACRTVTEWRHLSAAP